MKSVDKRFIFLVCLLIMACLLAWNFYFKAYFQRDTVDIVNFPKSIGSWEGEDLPIPAQDLAILETTNAFVRRYTNPTGEEVYLFIVYSQNNRKVSHPPEICYTGSGATIVDRLLKPIRINDEIKIHANHLVVEKGKEKQIVLYWFKVGNTFTPNYWRQQALIALKSFFGESASSALIRLSIDARDDSKVAQAEKTLLQFAHEIYSPTFRYLP